MVEVAEAINSFLPDEREAYSHVPPLEEPVFILTSGQLQEIISQAITQALEERQEALPEAQIGQEKLLQVVEAQAQEIRSLKSLLQALGEKVGNLESLQEVFHGEAPAQEERPILREAWERRREAQEGLPSRVWSLEEDLQSLEREVRSERPPAQALGGGRKTLARVEKIRQILKASGGSRTFQELEKSLGLSPSQFTYLVSHMDKRSFEVSRRPGGKRGEKVLSLRVKIREGLVFT